MPPARSCGASKLRSCGLGPWWERGQSTVEERPGYLEARFSCLGFRFAFRSCWAGFFEAFPPPLSLLATFPPPSFSSRGYSDAPRKVLSGAAERNDHSGYLPDRGTLPARDPSKVGMSGRI